MANRESWGKNKPPMGSVRNAAHLLSHELIGHWLFNENGGGIAHDSSGRNFHAVLKNGPIWSNDGILFDGTDDYLEGTGNTLFAFTTPFSVSFWIKAIGTPAIYDGIIGFVDTNGSWSIGWGLYWNGATSMRFFAGNYATQGVNENVATPSNWNHICAVYNGSSVFLYVNGISTTSQAVTITAGNDILRIGELRTIGTGHSYNHSGLLKDVRIYKRKLSQQEVFVLCAVPFKDFQFAKRRNIIGASQAFTADPPVETRTFVIPAVTASFSVSIVASAPVETHTFVLPTQSASYAVAYTASVTEESHSFIIPSVTASYSVNTTASVTEQSSSFVIPSVTASHFVVVSADAASQNATFSIPSVSCSFSIVFTASCSSVSLLANISIVDLGLSTNLPSVNRAVSSINGETRLAKPSWDNRLVTASFPSRTNNTL